MAQKRRRMSDTSHSPNPTDDFKTTEYSYRGRKVQVHENTLNRTTGSRLLIDDKEIPIEQTESGVISHLAMYKEFGSPYELAEFLIRDWGTATIEDKKSKDTPRSKH